MCPHWLVIVVIFTGVLIPIDGGPSGIERMDLGLMRKGSLHLTPLENLRISLTGISLVAQLGPLISHRKAAR